MAGFSKSRKEDLSLHPTVKPVQMIADALLDCTQRGDVVLDFFGGSGSTLLAAERIGRRARLLEYEPRYVDVTIARWERMTHCEAVLEGDGRTFEEVRAERLAAPLTETAEEDDRVDIPSTIEPDRAATSAPIRLSLTDEEEADLSWLRLYVGETEA